jgi:TonB family protein
MHMPRLATVLLLAGVLVGWPATGRAQPAPQAAGRPAAPTVVQRKEHDFPARWFSRGDLIVLVEARIGVDGRVVSAAPVGRYAPAHEGEVRIAVRTVEGWRFQSPSGAEVTTLVGINFAQPANLVPVDSSVPVGRDVKRPRVVHHAPALYPDNVTPDGGKPSRGVLVGLTIESTGIPVDAVALEPVTALTASALDAALRWRFEANTKVPRRRVEVNVPFAVPASFGPPRAEWPAMARTFDGREEKNVVPPKAVRQAQPFYTSEAIQKKQQGNVILEVLVGVDGAVLAGRVTRSLPLLDRSALDCVRKWEFAPMLVDGRPTPAVVTIDLRFSLK